MCPAHSFLNMALNGIDFKKQNQRKSFKKMLNSTQVITGHSENHELQSENSKYSVFFLECDICVPEKPLILQNCTQKIIELMGNKLRF